VSKLDLAIVVVYFALSLGVGLWVARHQSTAKDYFLGARDLPAWAILLSIVATETSALTVISVPGVGARGNLTFLQLAIGYLVGRIGVAAWLLPGYFEGEQETAYARLERRFGGRARRLTSVVFLVTRFLGDAVRVFASAIPLSLVTGWSIPHAVVVMGIVTLVYTWFGGFKAVVWTDVFQLSIYLAGGGHRGQNYLVWQLFRRPNHTWSFYPSNVPLVMGPLVVACALLGLYLLRRQMSWRETLLLSWILVPAVFFQLWPVKGFQYLLPIAPPVAVLAARTLALWELEPAAQRWRRRGVAAARPTAALIAGVATSLAVASWVAYQPSKATTFLAGSGGVPGGREAGRWIAANVPVGARMMSVGPSMANILQYYGHRKILGLSVSPNPLHRNPVYEAMPNPDRLIRDNELQYIVWDAFSADRSPFFSRKLIRYIERYHGRVAHTETVPVPTRDGRTARKPVIVIYEVRP